MWLMSISSGESKPHWAASSIAHVAFFFKHQNVNAALKHETGRHEAEDSSLLLHLSDPSIGNTSLHSYKNCRNYQAQLVKNDVFVYKKNRKTIM